MYTVFLPLRSSHTSSFLTIVAASRRHHRQFSYIGDKLHVVWGYFFSYCLRFSKIQKDPIFYECVMCVCVCYCALLCRCVCVCMCVCVCVYMCMCVCVFACDYVGVCVNLTFIIIFTIVYFWGFKGVVIKLFTRLPPPAWLEKWYHSYTPAYHTNNAQKLIKHFCCACLWNFITIFYNEKCD